jgi:hypothetical protein
LDAGGRHSPVGCIEVVNTEEESHATGELLPNRLCLSLAIGPGKQDACLRSNRSDDNPSLRPSVIGQRRCIFHQFKLKRIYEEPNRGS